MELKKAEVGEYHFGSFVSLDQGQIAELISLAQIEPPSVPASLGGRSAVIYGQVRGLGEVVVKPYTRGGFFGRFVRRTHLAATTSRADLEFKMLTKVREIGVLAPEPLVSMTKGKLFYRAWLVTRKIENQGSLAAIAESNHDLLNRALEHLISQVLLLIEQGIFHVDLHPGNVVIDAQGLAHILDFDKAVDWTGEKQQLRDRYIFRWRRAVLKHKLSQTLSEIFSLGLRRSFK